ncbi:Uncharacterised protein [Mycobacteroides abscessus]|uniref:hypothetical protein n=1 Tax=Mycobacteroides abscessus TaxID=36809 RepID=UPI0005E534D3|nr:hypothetical protein [Mycobacteroides abscessus]CPR39628.1 Uncharacterised protein [Mycobacteroides abscessus]CPR91312.1 Uncharacterised protein [Mycobacteroides abscessus]CPR95643.1 Uncharacterised protein [Mycobacteroides abscessus]CPS17941.1 Uncharacterised protein [Mycobacteroides abscessus]CPS41381.1 Uncharacterised protein [Mycobacteroides abscessus]
MNSPEFPRNPDQPDREQVPDNELDLTGSVEQPGTLIDVIFKAISDADAADQIPEWGARTMARYLANLLPSTTSALHHFAITGRPDHSMLRHELADLRAASESRFTNIVISWLAGYLQAQYRRQVIETRYPEHLKALITELGPAFGAFLALPDVDSNAISEADAREHFGNVYYTSFRTVDEIVADVIDGLDVRRRLDAAELTDVASPDPVRLMKLADQRWDIVPHGGRYYLFEK